MRRFLAILLMMFVPLQLAWSAAGSLHGHLNDEVPVSGFHYHDDGHVHHHGAESDHHDGFSGGDTHNNHNDDGHHDGHYHPVFSMLVIEPDLRLGAATPNGPPVRVPIVFTSYIPPLFDRPPSALL